ncbi:MAG: ketoacyl-ACP synthase III [Oscillospiraceae bacterium]|jgi:3-oxoacyl-[acyl-carrier-protein] synthase-3|nr:ketoacyl-ACP synthase III [Oscillospiraceae bacterium]
MSGITILGTGSYSPEFRLTNAMLESAVDTSDEWITLRTGIKERRIAAADETTLDMASSAAGKALRGIDISQIAVIVAATLTPDYLTPSLACLLQRELGLPERIIAIDVNSACTGFVVALKTAHSLLADAPGKLALVVGCEMLSRVTDYGDRSTCVLFGDGAGAAVIRREPDGVFAFDSGARGGTEYLSCRAGYLGNSPFVVRTADKDCDGIHMNGGEVFRFAVETASASVARVLGLAEVALGSVKRFIFHQANRRIIDAIARRMGIAEEKCFVNIERYGNTSSATCAIALDELLRSGAASRGDGLIMSAFGGGLTYASLYFEINGDLNYD